MAYEVRLTDDTTTWLSPPPKPPLSVETIEAAIDVTTLDLNVYTDLIGTKRLWTANWGTMTETEFAALKAFYDRQFTLYKYPRLTIDDLGVSNVVVRMTITSQDIVGDTGLVDGVTITLRETIQTSQYYLVS